MCLDATDRRHSIWLFFGGFAEPLVGQTEAATALLQKSLERNPTYGSAQLSLMVVLSLTGPHRGAALMAESFRQQYLEAPTNAFERLFDFPGLSRSGLSPVRQDPSAQCGILTAPQMHSTAAFSQRVCYVRPSRADLIRLGS